MKAFPGMLALLPFVTAGTTLAGEIAENRSFVPGWYVAPMVSYTWPDAARCGVDGAPGAAVVIGHRGDFASIELWGEHSSLPYDCTYVVPAPTATDPEATETVNEQGDLKLGGGGVNLLVGPFAEQEFLSRFFGLVGFGALGEKDLPHPQRNTSSIIGTAGLGYIQPFELWDFPMNLRSEVRYRYDFIQPPRPDNAERDFQDWIFNLGVQVALSPRDPGPETMPEPVAVVAPAYVDTDNDGVIDERDQCPDTPTDSFVDNAGCPMEPAPPPPAPAAEPTELDQAVAGDTVVLKGVNFESGSDRLRANSKTILDGVADTLLRRPEINIEIGGHTDSQGGESYNQQLSEARAESVRMYLLQRGVSAEQMTAVGYGESLPVDTNDTAAGRELNRRVELRVLDQ